MHALQVYFIDPLIDPYSLSEIAVKASPLVMIGVGLSLCYLANVWNIGAEGQFLIGAVCGSWLAVVTHGTGAGPWVLPAMLVLGALGGALYALIPALCKVRFGASEILTSLMLVYVAELLLDYLVRGPWRDPHGFNFPTTADFDPNATMPVLFDGSRLHAGCVFALVVVAVAAVMLGRTIKGFEIRVVGRGAARGALCRLQFRPAGHLHLRGFRRAGRACRHHRGRRTDRPPAAQHFARLRLHRHHRRLPRPPQSDRHPHRRPVPGAHLHRRRRRRRSR